MQNGYKQFFKKAKQVRTGTDEPKKFSINKASKKKSKDELSKAHEDELRKIFMKPTANSKSKSKKHSTPWKFISSLALCTFIAGYGAYDPDGIHDLVKNINVEVGFLSKGHAKEGKGKAKKAQSKVKNAEKAAQTNPAVDNKEASAEKNWTTKDMSYFSKLRERKQQLDSREQELAKLEEELHKQKLEIEKRIVELQKVRDQISGVLKEKVSIDQGKVNKLVDFYSNMKPQQAAKVIANIDEDLAVEILGKMKKKNAADIMNLLQPKKAQMLSEKFAGYKRR